MATVTRTMNATPAELMAVLGDGWTYSNWVVGTSHMRAVDADWPAPGTRLHHASGLWPFVVRDATEVLQSTATSLVLEASGRPLGKARIEIVVEPAAGGCTVTMTEAPIAGPGSWVHNPLQDRLIGRRNTEALARLAAVAEHRTSPDA